MSILHHLKAAPGRFFGKYLRCLNTVDTEVSVVITQLTSGCQYLNRIKEANRYRPDHTLGPRPFLVRIIE